MNDESQLALMRFDFTSGAQRGSQLMLYPRCLVHRSDSHLETVPLARITAMKVSFQRDPHRLGWGVACVLAALFLLGNQHYCRSGRWLLFVILHGALQLAGRPTWCETDHGLDGISRRRRADTAPLPPPPRRSARRPTPDPT